MRAQSFTMGPRAASIPRALRVQDRGSVPRRPGCFAAPSLVAAASLWAATASAQAPSPKVAPPIALTWSAPASCPDTAAVSARIDKLLGGPPKATDRQLEAVATVEAIPRGFRLEITLTADGATSGRILQGAICESVADAAALVIALAFDPEAVAAQEQKQAASEGLEGPPPNNTSPPPNNPAGPVPADSAAPPSPSPPPPAEPAIVRIPVLFPPPRVVPAPPSEPASSITYGAFAQFAGDAGSLPGVAPGVRAGLSLGIGAFRIEPAFEAWPSSRSSVADRPGTGAEMRLLAGSLDVCRRIWPSTSPEVGQARVGPPVPGPSSSAAEVDLSSVIGCLGFEIGEMRGTGFGVAAPKSAGALWAAPRADLRAELSLFRHVALTLDLGLAVPVDRKTFVLTLTGSRAVAHEPSPVSGRAGAGVAIRF